MCDLDRSPFSFLTVRFNPKRQTSIPRTVQFQPSDRPVYIKGDRSLLLWAIPMDHPLSSQRTSTFDLRPLWTWPNFTVKSTIQFFKFSFSRCGVLFHPEIYPTDQKYIKEIRICFTQWKIWTSNSVPVDSFDQTSIKCELTTATSGKEPRRIDSVYYCITATKNVIKWFLITWWDILCNFFRIRLKEKSFIQ